MKTTRNVLFGLLLLGSTAGIAAAQVSFSAGIQIGSGGRSSVDLGFFYDNLASYGNWIERPSYGWVWTPREVSSSWRPYQDGHWVWTDQGWTWISEEPYGWATYHYGRWYNDPEIGWSWVPGNDWAPAWVDWQEGDNYVGWAPLPPSFDINVSYDNGGYGGGYGGYNRYGIAAESYVFVQERYILAPRIVQYVVPEREVVTILPRTRSYTNYRHDGDRIFNQGIPIEHVQRAVGRPVTRYQLADLQSGYQQRGARIQGDRVEIFRPQVRNTRVAPPVSRPAAREAVVSAQQFQANHPNRAPRLQRENNPQAYGRNNGQNNGQGYRQNNPGQRYGQDQAQGQPDRQRQYNGQRPQDGQNQNGRLRQYNPQPQDQQNPADRRRQYDAQGQQQDRANRQQDQANRQRQYDAQRQQPQDRGYRQPQDRTNQQPQDRQRQYDAQRQQPQDRGNQPQDRTNQRQQDRQRQYDAQRQQQQDQAARQQDQGNRQRQQQDRARQQDQGDRQPPPQADRQRQQPPNRNGDNQGQQDNNQRNNQRNKDRQQQQRDRERQRNQDQNQNQDDHRPPAPRR